MDLRILNDQLQPRADIDEHVVEAFEVVLNGAADCIDHDEAQGAFEAFDDLVIER